MRVLEDKDYDEESLTHTHCLWAAGASAQDLACKLLSLHVLDTTDEGGWISVGPTLQSTSQSYVFAAGDCAPIVNLPNGRSSPPKAAVYAVRIGPISL